MTARRRFAGMPTRTPTSSCSTGTSPSSAATRCADGSGRHRRRPSSCSPARRAPTSVPAFSISAPTTTSRSRSTRRSFVRESVRSCAARRSRPLACRARRWSAGCASIPSPIRVESRAGVVGMGVIPLQASHSGRTSDHCRLCAAAAERDQATTTISRKLVEVIPLGLAACLGLFLAAIDGGVVGAVGAGVAAGVATASLYLRARRRSFRHEAEDAHASTFQELSDDADSRVQAVITQFEWAVHDVASLRTRLDESEAQVRSLTDRAREREHQNEQLVRQISRLRERLTEIAMAASLADSGKRRRAPLLDSINFSWRLQQDGVRTRIELETALTEDAPTRVRVTDPDGQVVAASGVAVLSVEGKLSFQLELPLDLAGQLDAGREITSYDIEALVVDEWRRVRLKETKRVASEDRAAAVRMTETDVTSHGVVIHEARRTALH